MEMKSEGRCFGMAARSSSFYESSIHYDEMDGNRMRPKREKTGARSSMEIRFDGSRNLALRSAAASALDSGSRLSKRAAIHLAIEIAPARSQARS